jgi:hypothetical protein
MTLARNLTVSAAGGLIGGALGVIFDGLEATDFIMGSIVLAIMLFVVALLVDTISPGWENAPWTKKMWVSVILSPLMGIMGGIEGGGVLSYAIIVASVFLTLFLSGTIIGALLNWFFPNWWVKS